MYKTKVTYLTSSLNMEYEKAISLRLNDMAKVIGPCQWFSTRATLSPRVIWQYLETFLIFTTGMGKWEAERYWHLAGKSQGCCQTSYNAQDSHLQQKFIQPQMSILPRLRSPELCLVSRVGWETEKRKTEESHQIDYWWNSTNDYHMWIRICQAQRIS